MFEVKSDYVPRQVAAHVLNLHHRRSGMKRTAPETSAHGQSGTVEDNTFFSIMSAIS